MRRFWRGQEKTEERHINNDKGHPAIFFLISSALYFGAGQLPH